MFNNKTTAINARKVSSNHRVAMSQLPSSREMSKLSKTDLAPPIMQSSGNIKQVTRIKK